MDNLIEQGICQRTLTVDLRWQKDGDGNLWFVAKDVCDMLGLTDVSMATKSLDDDEKDTSKVCTLGGEQSMTTISESGMYALIMRSNKEEARKFRKWVTSEVLPSIRKTGKYEGVRQVAERMDAELAEMKATVRAGLIKGDLKKMGMDLCIRPERIGSWLKPHGKRARLNREEVEAVLGWVREKNMRIVNEHIKAQVEMKF